MVVSMVPGLLAGLESSGIDYDAVAYRTGVILVEDPGWWAEDPNGQGEGQERLRDGPSWEMVDKDKIKRVGLAVSRETPNILLSTKVEKFFSTSFFDEDDYRSKAIFGDIPYSYNFSLNISNPDGTYDLKQTGSPIPLGYGYIRRVVKIKEPGVAEINESFKDRYTGVEWNSTARNFTVRLDFSHLLDPTIKPIYRINPRIEPVNVTITDFRDYLNDSYEDAALKNVTFWKTTKEDPRPVRLSWLSYNEKKPDTYTLHLDGDSHNLTPNEPVNSSISLVLRPNFMTFMGPTDTLDIQFNFDENPPKTNITGIHHYNNTSVTRPDLKTAVLEVAIW
jgi:hypothetical protein